MLYSPYRLVEHQSSPNILDIGMGASTAIVVFLADSCNERSHLLGPHYTAVKHHHCPKDMMIRKSSITIVESAVPMVTCMAR